MTERERLFVVAYDVSSDRGRRRIGECLDDYGMRVQRSVFEVRMTFNAVRALAQNLTAYIEAGDRLRVYPVDTALRKESIVIGGPPLSEAEDFWLL